MEPIDRAGRTIKKVLFSNFCIDINIPIC